MEVVGEIGVDINESGNFRHKRGLLQFVAGLGRRKAEFINRKLKQVGGILTRSDLLMDKYVGKIVFMNCAGFLRISGVAVKDLLDMTRIHPDSYNLAIKICKDSCEGT